MAQHVKIAREFRVAPTERVELIDVATVTTGRYEIDIELDGPQSRGRVSGKILEVRER